VTASGQSTRRVYLPAGRWYDLHAGAIYDGPTTIDVPVTLAALPAFARAGAIVPRDSDAGLVVDIYPGPSPSTFTLFDGTRITYEPLADGARVAFASEGAPRPVRIRMVRVDGGASSVDGAAFEHDADARTLSATATTQSDLRFRFDPAISDLRPPLAVTFDARIPADTAGTIHVALSTNDWTHVPLTRIAPDRVRGTVMVPRGAWLEYKFTRGSWETVEKVGTCGERANRHRVATSELRVDSVATWRDRCP
jgi:hypothetical protein